MTAAHGAPHTNHSSHVIWRPIWSWMKPTATRFWAAEVMMPMFQMEMACAAVMTSRALSFESVGMPKAATRPMRIGTTAPARAVADGTKKDRMIVMTIVPMRMLLVFSPANFSTSSATRLCSPVACMAAASTRAPATRATAELEKPPSASPRAPDVPRAVSGSAMSGANPTRNAISPMMSTALTG